MNHFTNKTFRFVKYFLEMWKNQTALANCSISYLIYLKSFLSSNYVFVYVCKLKMFFLINLRCFKGHYQVSLDNIKQHFVKFLKEKEKTSRLGRNGPYLNSGYLFKINNQLSIMDVINRSNIGQIGRAIIRGYSVFKTKWNTKKFTWIPTEWAFSRLVKVHTMPCNHDWYPRFKSGLRLQVITSKISPRYGSSFPYGFTEKK